VVVSRRAATLSLATGSLFVLLTVLVAVRWQPLVDLDVSLLRSIEASVADGGALMRTMDLVSLVFAPGVLRTALVLTALLLVRRGMTGPARWVAVAVGVELALVQLLKLTLDRPRPLLAANVAEADGWAYPSGHTSAGALMCGVVVVLGALLVRRAWLRAAMTGTAVALALLLGASRLVLGVHFPTDVLGGLLLAPTVLAATAATLGVVRPRRRRSAPAPAVGAQPERKPRLAVVLNPIKVDDAKALRRMVNDAADRAGWDTPLWFETSVDDAGRQMTHVALTAGSDVVVAAGGDGTVRVVASELARTGVALGILPVGTSNMLARNLALPLQMDLALDVVLSGRDRPIDLVRMGGDGMDDGYFAVMGGLGLDAAIMQGAPDELKKRVGWPAYFLAGLRHMRDPAVRVEITVDDGPTVRYRARTVVIGNVGTLTGGIPLLPDAAPDDGKLDVVVVAPRRFLTWIPLLVRVLARRRRTDERLGRLTGRSVVVRAEHPTPRQMDGDSAGVGTGINATIQPGVLLVRVPR
jgi:diacylglycerol kinase family enzyme/membrane-associated phospholipid phosphatase